MTDFDNKLLSFNERINSNKIKHVLVENKLNELSNKVETISTKGLAKDLINGCKILNGVRYISLGTLQNLLMYFSYKKCFWFFTNTFKVLSWKTVGLSEEGIENVSTSDSNLGPTLIIFHYQI